MAGQCSTAWSAAPGCPAHKSLAACIQDQLSPVLPWRGSFCAIASGSAGLVWRPGGLVVLEECLLWVRS